MDILRKTALISLLISLFFVFFVGLPSASAETDVSDVKAWSLGDLYERALDRSEEIRIAREQLYITQKDKNIAIAALIPDFAAFGQYTVYDESNTLYPDASTAYGVTVGQSFTLNGRELLGFKIAKDLILKADYDLAATKESYLFMVAAAYYQVLKLTETKKTAQVNVKRLEAHKEAVLLQLRLETIPKTELYRTEAELSASKTGLVQAENSLQSARIYLAGLVDLPEHYTLNLPEFTRDVPFELDYIEKTALLNRSDLKAANMDKTIAKANIRVTRGGYWPYVSLEGTYTKMDIDPSLYMPTDLETGEVVEDNFSAGVSVNFPLFEGGKRRAELSQAKAQEKQADLLVKAYEKQVSIEVRQAYLDMVTAKSTIDSLKDQLTSAQKNFEAVSQHFKTGLANSLDVMDANTLLTKSEKELVEAKYDYELAILNLKMAGGVLLKSIQDEIHDKEK